MGNSRASFFSSICTPYGCCKRWLGGFTFILLHVNQSYDSHPETDPFYPLNPFNCPSKEDDLHGVTYFGV